jgi:hypothetical protein
MKFNVRPPGRKIMATAFWDLKGALSVDFLDHGGGWMPSVVVVH